MAITFPANPANGETHTHNGQIYVYNSTRGYWLLKKSADISVQQAQRSTFIATASQTTHSVVYDAGSPVVVSVNGVMLNPSDFTAENGTSITFETALTVNDEVDIVFYQPTSSNLTRHSVSDTAPSGASNGDLWFNSTNLKTYVYYDDGSSAQWVVTNPLGADGADGTDGSSVTTYANFAAFVNGTSEGDFAFAQDTKALYVWDGAEWDRVYSGPDEILNWDTEPNTEYAGAPSSNISITVAASDPEGFPVTYSYDTNPTSPTQLQSVSESAGVYTVTLSSNTGAFSFRSKATDGTHVISKTTTVTSGFQSASQLSANGITTSGNYNLYLNGFDNPATECYVNFDLAGGPWILVMVVADGATAGASFANSYDYDSSVWTDNTGGVTTALDPSSNTNQVSSLFYTLSTTATGLALGTNASTHFHYYNHSSYTVRDLANGTLPVPTSISHDSTTITANSEVADGDAGIAAGWTQAFLDTNGNAWNAGATYFRYGYQHGIPNPTGYGYIRFGHSADVDSSDSRDRVLGIGLKNGGSGPLGSNTAGAGGLNYISSSLGRVARTKGFLYIKN